MLKISLKSIFYTSNLIHNFSNGANINCAFKEAISKVLIHYETIVSHESFFNSKIIFWYDRDGDWHWLIFPYPSGLLHWHCGNLTIAPVPAKQPWWIWINTSCEFIMNDCITTTNQSTTKPCAYFLGYTVHTITAFFSINHSVFFRQVASLVLGYIIITLHEAFGYLHFGHKSKLCRALNHNNINNGIIHVHAKTCWIESNSYRNYSKLFRSPQSQCGLLFWVPFTKWD